MTQYYYRITGINLIAIDVAPRIASKLEKKKGDLKDFYAIWVNTQFRIIFRWEEGSAHDVELVDYH